MLGFLLMMASKWALTVMYYGKEYIEYLKYRGSLRTSIKGYDNYDNNCISCFFWCKKWYPT